MRRTSNDRQVIALGIVSRFETIGVDVCLIDLSPINLNPFAQVGIRTVAGDARVTIVELRRNYGQAAAMSAGFDYARGRVVFELGARVDVPEEFDTEVNPRFGVAYRLRNDATRLRASVGRAFKLPSFFALAVPVFGNPDLQPETVLGAEIVWPAPIGNEPSL